MTEEWYDDVIVPKLAEIAAECKAKGCAMVAVVEYAPGKRGSTLYTPEGSGLAMMFLRALDQAGENIDQFMFSVVKYCQREKIDMGASVFLRPFADSGNGKGLS